MSRAGTPTDNPVIESLNGWIKNELYKDFRIYFSEDINTAINAYIKYFNTQRLAYSLKYKTPVQYRTCLLYTSGSSPSAATICKNFGPLAQLVRAPGS